MAEKVVRAYRGPDGAAYLNKSISQIERMWSRSGLAIGTLDQLFSEQMYSKLSERGSVLTGIDIGSGKGELIQGIVNEFAGLSSEPRLSKSTHILNSNPQMRIRIAGLTDAKDAETFNRRRLIHPLQYGVVVPPHPQIEAYDAPYSLTFDQTFEGFLKSQDLESVDLVLATSTFVYFHPKLFEDTVRTAIKHLNPGGKLVAYGYLGGSFHGMLSKSIEVDGRSGDGSIKRLAEEAKSVMESKNIEPSEVAMLIRRLKAKIFDSKYGDENVVSEAVYRDLARELKDEDSLEELDILVSIGLSGLKFGWDTVKAGIIKEEKMKRLKAVTDEYKKEVLVNYNDQAVVIEKKYAAS